MKRLVKYIFYLSLSLQLLSFPVGVKAQSIFVSFGLGTLLGGGFSDTWQSTTDFFKQSIQPTKKSGTGIEFYAEMIFMVNDNFGLAIGGTYLNRSMTGSQGTFRFPETSELQGNFSYTPELTTSIMPIYASFIYSAPFLYKARLNLAVGVDYYFGRMRCYYENLDFDFSKEFSGWNYYAHLYETTDMKTMGYHVGVGLELELSSNSFFMLEIFYRNAKFKDYSTNVKEGANLPFMGGETGGETQEGQKVFLFGQKYTGEEEWGDVIYSINSLDLTSLSFRGGIKIRF
mgnify:CR=1 FL=1|jgi:opacity protein-like surface antigen